ncbi:hypothetical protein G6F68_011230 [Rhizopus microsporus]|nr:hypothetical protein G6F68_011230 [Rhizopus microsporus]
MLDGGGGPEQADRGVAFACSVVHHLREQCLGAFHAGEPGAGFQVAEAFVQHHVAVQRPRLLQILEHRPHVPGVPLHLVFAAFDPAEPVAQPRTLGQNLGAQVAVQVPVQDLCIRTLVHAYRVGIFAVWQVGHPILFLSPAQRVALRKLQATAPASFDEVLHSFMAAAPARVQVIEGVFQRAQVVGALFQHQAHPVGQRCIEIVLAALAQHGRQAAGHRPQRSAEA